MWIRQIVNDYGPIAVSLCFVEDSGRILTSMWQNKISDLISHHEG